MKVWQMKYFPEIWKFAVNLVRERISWFHSVWDESDVTRYGPSSDEYQLYETWTKQKSLMYKEECSKMSSPRNLTHYGWCPLYTGETTAAG